MSGFLLDVNVLIALLDPSHIHHDRAHTWFAAEGRDDWMSSPTTENAVLRIVSNPRYSNSQPVSVIAASLQSLLAVGSHCFIAEDASVLDASRVTTAALLGGGSVTDAHLLALAVHADARLATFDRRLPTAPVVGATADDVLLIA